nr:DUF1266 domain-containing protein [Microbacterium testaceum]
MPRPESVLQNHIGDVEFPVRRRRRYAAALDAARREDQKALGRRALWLTLFAGPLGVVAYLTALTVYPQGTEFSNPFVVFVGGLMVGLLVGVVFFAIRDAGAPLRAQRQYIALSGRQSLTLRQQQILALDASSDFSFRGWNSSLAFAPTYIELPEEVRRRHLDGQKGGPWVALPVLPVSAYRAALDEQFKIASRTDAEVLAADARAVGLWSQRFAAVASSPDGEAMMSRVAALTGVDVFDLIELTHPTDEAPATLLLAGDTERAIGALRYAYASGYLTAEHTWQLLEPLADRVFATYTGWDAYWRDVLIATAFRTDSLDAVQQQRDNLRHLAASDWPAGSLPFPRVDSPRRAVPRDTA